MELSSRAVFKILKKRGIKYLYHANSVLTTCLFLRAGKLLSRGTVEQLGEYQTLQNSDAKDKKNRIWFDVFTDAVDIHKKSGILNFYGPALLCLKIDILNDKKSGNIWITKMNPTKWSRSDKQKDRWFVNIADVNDNFDEGDFDQSIVFRHCDGKLNIKKYLHKIILDDPRIKHEGVSVYGMSYGALELALHEGGFEKSTIEKRRCEKGCGCRKKYAKNRFFQREDMFFPWRE